MFVERTTSTFFIRLVSNLAGVLQKVEVCDIFLETIIFFLAELSALGKCLIFNIAHACFWSELLLHFYLIDFKLGRCPPYKE